VGIKIHELLAFDCKSHYAWVFFCPACKSAHHCDNRWGFNGDLERPTFTGSILVHEVKVEDPAPGFENWRIPRCHSHVTDGKISFGNDCTHEMAGQTMDLPDWDQRKTYA